MSDSSVQDLHPLRLNVYGYCITIQRDDHWRIDPGDQYRNLPAHYAFAEEALERLLFLRSQGLQCRLAALLAEASDTVEEFEKNKIVHE
jgi:hypothetical protein